jgi:hypothetical protein
MKVRFAIFYRMLNFTHPFIMLRQPLGGGGDGGVCFGPGEGLQGGQGSLR